MHVFLRYQPRRLLGGGGLGPRKRKGGKERGNRDFRGRCNGGTLRPNGGRTKREERLERQKEMIEKKSVIVVMVIYVVVAVVVIVVVCLVRM